MRASYGTLASFQQPKSILKNVAYSQGRIAAALSDYLQSGIRDAGPTEAAIAMVAAEASTPRMSRDHDPSPHASARCNSQVMEALRTLGQDRELLAAQFFQSALKRARHDLR
jgi:hypothetical protein